MSCENCCGDPPCPDPAIECDSISATKSKAAPCGYLNPDDGLYYATKTEHYTRHWTQSLPDPGGQEIVCHFDYSKVSQKSDSSGPCVETIAWSGSCYYTVDPTDEYGDTTHVSATVNPDGSWTGTREFTRAGGEMESSPHNSPCCTGGTETLTTTYTDQVTAESTASLISRTVAALPNYPDAWTGSCSSYRNLSPDESSYSLRRIKWRVKHSPTGTCYLKVWLQTRFVPEEGGDPILTPLEPYTWSLAGNPCLPDPTKGPGHDENLIRSEVSEEQEPGTDGTISIEIIKFSCDPTYTPPDDGSANGLRPPPEA